MGIISILCSRREKVFGSIITWNQVIIWKIVPTILKSRILIIKINFPRVFFFFYVKEIFFSPSILDAQRFRCGCNGNFGNYIAITERDNGHSREFSRRSKLRRNYPGLSYVPTRRSDYVRLSTCAFSLWKEHCNVGTDAEFQRVKLNENVNESIASDMRNSNPIITEESELNGAGIFNNPSDTIIFLKKSARRDIIPFIHDPSP